VATGTPFTSVQALTGIASTAALVPNSAMVWVGPPLFCRPLGSSPATVPFTSPVPVKKLVQLVSSDRLYPCEVNVPELEQFPPEGLFASSVLFTVRVPVV
jgi:hypothetical protein